jgi:hypothetical protein
MLKILATNLAPSNCLRHLNLPSNDLTDASASLWCHFGSLHSLSLRDSSHIGESTLLAVSKLPILQDLDLGTLRTCTIDVSLSILLDCDVLPHLRSLRVKESQLDEQRFLTVINRLEKRPNLDRIEAISCGRVVYLPSLKRFFELLPNLIKSPFNFLSLDHIEELGRAVTDRLLNICLLPSPAVPFSRASLDDLRLVLTMPNLTSLELERHDFGASVQDDKDGSLAFLQQFHSLRKIEFDYCKRVPEGLRYPRSLRKLVLRNCELITVNQIPPGSSFVNQLLADAPELSELDLYHSVDLDASLLNIIYNDFTCLKDFSFCWDIDERDSTLINVKQSLLESFDFSYQPTDMYPFFESANQLRSFRMMEGRLNDIADQCIQSLSPESTPNLKRLCLCMGAPEEESHDLIIQTLTRLESLDYLSTDELLQQPDLSPLRPLTRLQTLVLGRIPSIDMLESHDVFQNLLNLSLRTSSLANFEQMPPLPWLQHLSLQRSELSYSHLLSFNSTIFPRLESLDIRGFSKIDIQVSGLLNLISVFISATESSIKIIDCPVITSAFFQYLNDCPRFLIENTPNLRTLSILRTKFKSNTRLSVACQSVEVLILPPYEEMRELFLNITSGPNFRRLETDS